MHRPTPRLIKPLLTLALVTALAGCCGCLAPPGVGGPGGGGRGGPGASEGGPAPRWRDAPPPHWQQRGSPEGQRQRPRHADQDDAPSERP